MTQLEHVKERLCNRISFFYDKRDQNRHMTVFLGMSSAFLSGSATVLIGSSKILSIGWLGIVAMIATSMATIIAVYESILSYKRLWSINNEVLAALEKLQREIAYRELDPREITKGEVDDFFGRLEATLEDADEAWVKTYAPKK